MKIVEGTTTRSTIALEHPPGLQAERNSNTRANEEKFNFCDLQVTSTNDDDYEGQMARQEVRDEIASIHPPDKDADITDIFANLWATLNHARREMIQQHSNQLFQAHNTYMNELRELDSLELTQAQLEYH